MLTLAISNHTGFPPFCCKIQTCPLNYRSHTTHWLTHCYSMSEGTPSKVQLWWTILVDNGVLFSCNTMRWFLSPANTTLIDKIGRSVFLTKLLVWTPLKAESNRDASYKYISILTALEMFQEWDDLCHYWLKLWSMDKFWLHLHTQFVFRVFVCVMYKVDTTWWILYDYYLLCAM